MNRDDINDCLHIALYTMIARTVPVYAVVNSGGAPVESDYSTWSREQFPVIQQRKIHSVPWGVYITQQDWVHNNSMVQLYNTLTYRSWSTFSWRPSMWTKKLHVGCTAHADRLHDSSTVPQRYPTYVVIRTSANNPIINICYLQLCSFVEQLLQTAFQHQPYVKCTISCYATNWFLHLYVCTSLETMLRTGPWCSAIQPQPKVDTELWTTGGGTFKHIGKHMHVQVMSSSNIITLDDSR